MSRDKQNKIDKRADALRDNLKRRKAKDKELQQIQRDKDNSDFSENNKNEITDAKAQ